MRLICAAVEWFRRLHVRKAALREGCSCCLSAAAAAAAVLVSKTLAPVKLAMARTQNIAIAA